MMGGAPARAVSRLLAPRVLGQTALLAGAALLLLALLLVATAGTKAMVGSLLVAAVVLALVLLGPELFGSLLMVGALGFAPLNRISPPGLPSFLTVTDVLFVGGLLLLVPRLLAGRPQVSGTYKAGAVLLFITGMLTGLLTAEGPLSLFYFMRLVVAAIVLPVAMSMWQPERRWLRALAWAYVGGQIVSEGWSLAHTGAGGEGRAIGLTEHPNYFGLAGQTALALLIFLYYETPRSRRWLVVGAALICAHSVYISGSRASLVCTVLILVLWPLIERSAVGWFMLLTGSLFVLTFASVLLSNAKPGSALYRLKGGGSAQGSDEERAAHIHNGITRFWDHPLTGSGFSNVFNIHNVYLQMAVAGGVVALLAFIIVVVSLMKPVLAQPSNRLAYVGISYAAIAMLGPVMWDRLVWAPLALIFAVPAAPPATRGPTTASGGEPRARPVGPVRLSSSPARSPVQAATDRAPVARRAAPGPQRTRWSPTSKQA
jgi:hypothetical protein